MPPHHAEFDNAANTVFTNHALLLDQLHREA